MTSFAEAPCSICIEDFNNSTRARITCPCPSCEFTCCRTCIRTYLLTTTELPHCMKCKARWERDMLTKATLTSYVNGDYKKHRKNILFDLEKSRLPETMPAVQNYLKVRELTEEVNTLDTQYTEVRHLLATIKHQKEITRANINRAKDGRPLIDNNYAEKKTVQKVFKQACPAEGCRGFLSTAWKCGICASWVCSKCLVLKGKEKDDGHECNPDDVKTAAFIRSQTKNCPSCAVPIEKISGCDQMWCTQCHVAFSWKTGRRVNGVVHNPHFYQWQAHDGGAAPLQPPGAQVCGGLPTAWRFRTNIESRVFYNYGGRTPPRMSIYDTHPKGAMLREWNNTVQSILALHRGMRHFTHYELERVRQRANNIANNTDLRIKFITKEIDKAAFQKRIVSRDKQHEKNLAILQIYELINTVFTESIRDVWIISENKPSMDRTLEQCAKETLGAITRNMTRCEKLRLYANKELIKISILYSMTVGIIDDEYYTQSKKFKKKDMPYLDILAVG